MHSVFQMCSIDVNNVNTLDQMRSIDFPHYIQQINISRAPKILQ